LVYCLGIEDLRQLDEGVDSGEEPDGGDGDEAEAGAADKHKKKRRKRRRRDPNAPKRPQSAYLVFCGEQRPKLSANHPELKMVELAAKLGTLWRELEPEQRSGYEAQAATDKQRYLLEMERYVPPDHHPTDLPAAAAAAAAQPQAGKATKRQKMDPAATTDSESMCSICEEGGRLLCW
jgi:hypothetical protein